MKHGKMNPILFGVLGMISMMAFYYVLLFAITRDPLHPFLFFMGKWILLSLLFLGFGVQMFLFQKLRISLHTLSMATAGTSAGTSGIAMAACCAHHIADILPIFGFMGVASVMTEYQDWLLAFGVVMNAIGVLYMWIKLSKFKNDYNCKSSCSSLEYDHV